MTVSSTQTRADYPGNGVTVLFPIPFYFIENGHIVATLSDTGTTPPTFRTLVFGTDYTLIGAGNQAGGSATLAVAPTVTQSLDLERLVPATQETQYVENDTFPSSAHEQALDKLTMVDQQVLEVLGRTLVAPIPETMLGPLPSVLGRAGKILSFDDAGQPVATFVSGDSAASVGAALAAFIAALAAPAGALTLGYKSALAGAVLRTVQSKVSDFVSVYDFGTRGDGSTDDTTLLQLAINQAAAAGYTLQLPKGGIFMIAPGGLAIPSNALIAGSNSVLRSIAAPTSAMLNAVGVSGIDIRGLTLDGGDFAVASNVAMVSFANSTNVSFGGNRVIKFDRFGLAFGTVDQLDIANNYFSKTTAAATQNEAIVGAGLVVNTNVRISGNQCENSAIDVSMAGGEISFNRISNWKFGGGITTEQDASCFGLQIIGNVCQGGTGIDVNATRCLGIENWARDSVLQGNRCVNNAGDGIDTGGQNCTVTGNTCVNNGVSGGSGIAARYGDGFYNASGSTFAGNRCYNTSGSSGPQLFGYQEQSALLNDIVVSGNQFKGNRTGPVSILSATTTFAGISVEATSSFAAGTIAAAGRVSTTTTLAGAVVGDVVTASYAADLAGVSLSAYVSAVNVVTAVFLNGTGGSVALGTANLTVRATKNKSSPDI